MDHAVLYPGKRMFDVVVDFLGDVVGLIQGQGAFGTDFHVHVYHGAEIPCFEGVQAKNSRNGQNGLPQGVHHWVAAGLVRHLRDGIQEDVQGRLQDEETDDDAGQGIHDGKAQ